MRKRTKSYDAAEIHLNERLCWCAVGVEFCLLFLLRPSTRALLAFFLKTHIRP